MRYLTAALIVENHKLLLVHNTKHNQKRIEPPGGKKEINESLKDCVIREVKEELGIEIEVEGLFSEVLTDSPEGKFIVRMFICKIIKGIPKIMEPEIISEFAWYSYDDLVNLSKGEMLVDNVTSALDEIKELLS